MLYVSQFRIMLGGKSKLSAVEAESDKLIHIVYIPVGC